MGVYLNGLLSFHGLGRTTDGIKTNIFLLLLLNSIESSLYIALISHVPNCSRLHAPL